MTSTSLGTSLKACAAAAVLMVLAACQGAGQTDMAGNEATVLRLASIDQVNDTGQAYGPQAFVDSLSEVSDGELKVQVVTNYGGGDPAAESNLVKAIASGDVDGGWPATRAFANAGIGGLEAVEAPMTITSYAAQKALVTAPVAGELLSSLDGSGVMGLGLAVGPLRRPFAATAPLLGVSDWEGITFRSYNSPVQSAAIEALGASPVDVGFEWIDQVSAGQLRGAEFDVAQYVKNGNGTEAGNVTSNVVLWPKVFVLSFSQDRFDELTPQQQAWVREAADAAVQASVDADYDEGALAATLCDRGVSFHTATPEQLDGLRAAFLPVIDRLAADTRNAPVLRALQDIAVAHPTTDVPDAAGVCLASDGPLGEIPDTPSPLPDGVYRVALTADEITDAGFDHGPGFAGTWTLAVRGSVFELSCRPLDQPGVDCGEQVSDVPLEAGDLRGTGQTVFFVYDPDRLSRLTGCTLPVSQQTGHCFDGKDYRMTWALSGDELTFTDYASDNWPNDMYLVKPWQKIG